MELWRLRVKLCAMDNTIRPHPTAHVVLKFLIDLTHTMLMECACSLMAAVVGSRGTSMGM